MRKRKWLLFGMKFELMEAAASNRDWFPPLRSPLKTKKQEKLKLKVKDKRHQKKKTDQKGKMNNPYEFWLYSARFHSSESQFWLPFGATKQTSIANTEFNRIQLAFNSITTEAVVGLFKALLHLVAMSESNVLPFHLSPFSFNHFNGKQLVLHFRK